MAKERKRKKKKLKVMKAMKKKIERRNERKGKLLHVKVRRLGDDVNVLLVHMVHDLCFSPVHQVGCHPEDLSQ